MPKEIVHWMVAERAAQLLADSPFAPALVRCPNGLKLGAVLHDTLFYLRGEHPAGMKNLPHRLHGSHGEDSFDILRLQAAHMRQNADQPLPAAVFVGLASHIFADVNMHPMIYHLTGNYYAQDERARTSAVQHHRALEGLLDMVAVESALAASPLGGGVKGPDAVLNKSLKLLVAGLEGPLELAWPSANLARLAGCQPEGAKKALLDSLDTYQTMQGLFRMQFLARLLRDLAPVLPAQACEIVALFYAPQLYEQRAAVSGSIGYRHPVTGENLRASLAELMERAARQTADFCRAQAEAIARRGELAAQDPGPTLDMGLPGVPVSQARFFAATPLPRD